MGEDEIYAYCLERLDELQENIWELAKENGIPRTQEEADKINKMIPFFLLSNGTSYKEDITKMDEENLFLSLTPIYQSIVITFLVQMTAVYEVKQRKTSFKKALINTEQAWYVFGAFEHHIKMRPFLEPFDENILEDFRSKVLSSLGRKGADIRHSETRSMREDAIEYWRKNIDPKLSTPKAADILIKVVPLSHRKLEEIIRKAKTMDKND